MCQDHCPKWGVCWWSHSTVQNFENSITQKIGGNLRIKKNLSSGNVESNLNSIEELEMCPITFRSNVCADGHTLQSEILGTP